ncbi:Regucalcin [Armadillidium vulgare]|nr:Regucalcin [Armadillidium vulgare]
MDTEFGEKHEKYFGNLYSIDSDSKISRLVTNVGISNGLAWSRDNKTFYYIDTMEYRVDAFDYSLETGDISNRRPVFEFKSHPEVKGKPDGMSIDENDNLWVACFDGFQILNIDPRKGKLLRIVDMPSRNITSTCWGGPDYSTLFVTSAGKGCEIEIADYPDTGKTFAVIGLGVKGLPPKKFKVNDISKFLKS